MQNIAATTVHARSCDTLLSNCNSKLLNRDQLILKKDSNIANINKQLFFKNNIITLKEEEILDLNKTLKKEKTKRVFTNIGWGIVNISLLTGLIYFIIH